MSFLPGWIGRRFWSWSLHLFLALTMNWIPLTLKVSHHSTQSYLQVHTVYLALQSWVISVVSCWTWVKYGRLVLQCFVVRQLTQNGQKEDPSMVNFNEEEVFVTQKWMDSNEAVRLKISAHLTITCSLSTNQYSWLLHLPTVIFQWLKVIVKLLTFTCNPEYVNYNFNKCSTMA